MIYGQNATKPWTREEASMQNYKSSLIVRASLAANPALSHVRRNHRETQLETLENSKTPTPKFRKLRFLQKLGCQKSRGDICDWPGGKNRILQSLVIKR